MAIRYLDDPELIARLQARADAGVRIYLLLGEDARNRSAIEALAGRCLIRCGVKQNGTLLLLDQGADTAQGFILSGGIPDSRYWLKLTTGQCDDYFRLFCHLFWQQAGTEYLRQGQQSQQAVVSPLGTIDLNHQDALAGKLGENLRQAWSEMQYAMMSDSVSLFDLKDLPEAGRGTLICELSQLDASRAIKLGESVASLVLTEQDGMPQIVQGYDRSHWMLPSRTREQDINWCIRLAPEQLSDVSSHLARWGDAGRWQYRSRIRIADIGQPVRFADQLELEQQCLPRRSVELDPVQAPSIDDFLEASARDLAASQIRVDRERLAHVIDYKVEIRPPLRPEQAVADPLHRAWTQVRQKWSGRVDELSGMLNREASSRGGIGERILGALGSFIASQDHRRKELERELEVLASWDCALFPPSVRSERLEQLNNIAKQLHKRRERWAEKVDETRQQQEWGQKRQRLADDLRAANEAADKCRRRADENRLNSDQALEQLKKNLLDGWHAWIRDSGPQLSPQKFWDAAGMAAFDASEALAWIDKYHSQLPGDPKRTVKRLRDDYRTGQQKQERDLKELEKRQQQAVQEIARLEQALQDHGDRFQYRPSANPVELGRLLGVQDSAAIKPLLIDWPDEDLPQPGTHLVSFDRQRWLVIDSLDQLEAARQDAQRLNAIICTEKPENA
ncbi:hypothetical protein [Marinobacterium aestuariivivens]|uniref:hypothetical protein n=1 Tax=Marinobacterium aestuariivivens TaxID=1698799 RepID=UPI0036D34FD9